MIALSKHQEHDARASAGLTRAKPRVLTKVGLTRAKPHVLQAERHVVAGLGASRRLKQETQHVLGLGPHSSNTSRRAGLDSRVSRHRSRHKHKLAREHRFGQQGYAGINKGTSTSLIKGGAYRRQTATKCAADCMHAQA